MYDLTHFQRRLDEEFHGRLRIRWSLQRHEYHIEQRVGRAVIPPLRIEEGRDDLIRARDGYDFLMAIRPGTRMPCPTCHLDVSVPIMEFRETACPHCAIKGRDGRITACYFPLGERLLDELRARDPLKGGPARMRAMMDAANARLEATRDREFRNYNEDVVKDHFGNLFGIQQVGYTGRVFAGASA